MIFMEILEEKIKKLSKIQQLKVLEIVEKLLQEDKTNSSTIFEEDKKLQNTLIFYHQPFEPVSDEWEANL